MIGACISASIGQILVRRGMLQVGELSGWSPRYLIVYFWHALTNPWVIAGTVGNALFYFLFLAVLSWAPVAVALPLTALEYAIAAVLGILFLREPVPPLRWAGIALVVAGVVLIGLDRQAETRREQARPRADVADRQPTAGPLHSGPLH
ncbi:MAG TPA: DMT family transporter [Thermoanaerobaculia bacterium]|nr:DMT family transporter [Thermoanaerobaculia bacterium]